jgi:CopG family nickel-responsive transcriptional regulator
MTIISISLNEKILKELDRLQSEMGFSGRSEVIRAGIRNLLADTKEKESFEGKIRAILLLIHTHNEEDYVTEVKHEYLDIIYTQLHNRFKEGKCMEIFILDGESERIKKLTRTFQTKEIDYVKLLVI